MSLHTVSRDGSILRIETSQDKRNTLAADYKRRIEEQANSQFRMYDVYDEWNAKQLTFYQEKFPELIEEMRAAQRSSDYKTQPKKGEIKLLLILDGIRVEELITGRAGTVVNPTGHLKDGYVKFESIEGHFLLDGTYDTGLRKIPEYLLKVADKENKGESGLS